MGGHESEPSLTSLALELQALRARVAQLDAQSPLERYFDLPSVADLLGCPLSTVETLLSRHKPHFSPAVYRWDQRHRKHRMLPVSDVHTLRTLRLRARLHDLPPWARSAARRAA